jgi:hypothetical protein
VKYTLTSQNATTLAILTLCLASFALGQAATQKTMKQWKFGIGWGWVWGGDDEIGSLNEMNDTSRLSALRIASRGEVFDLGVIYDRDSFMPVHNYLLIQQGVHIGEFHYLEELSKNECYEFCYVCTTNKIRGATAGFALRPIAIR